jgi:hypothetical protein
MKTSVERNLCPKCNGSGMSFTTEQKGDGFSVSWIPCECKNTMLVPLAMEQTTTPIFL